MLCDNIIKADDKVSNVEQTPMSYYHLKCIL